MAINITWGTKVINIARTDVEMTQIQTLPIPIYNLDLNAFRFALKDLEDTEEGMAFLDTHSHNPPLTVGGVDLARTIEIINGYTITFEDAQYAVNLIGANSNTGDLVNVNQVSVRSANSAGLVTSTAIEYGEYGGAVTIDTSEGVTGTIYPTGTPRQPSSNLANAVEIATSRGFDTIRVIGDYTFLTSDVIDGFIIKGQSPTKSYITLTTQASITNCDFKDATVDGFLDGGSNLDNCHIIDLNYVDGTVKRCELGPGTITLNGASAEFIECWSGVAGNDTPIIDMGATGTDLMIRGYNGGVKLINYTSGINPVSIDISSGHVILDTTISSGAITVRGVGKLTNNSTGTSVILEELLDSRNINKTLFLNGSIYLDSNSSETGELFPLGTAGRPVSSLTDALAIAATNGLKHINMTGFFSATASHNLDGITLQAGSGSQDVIGLNGCSTIGSSFKNFIIYGALKGLARVEDCILGTTGLGGLTEVEGRIRNCIINNAAGLVQKTTGAGTLLDNCSFIAPNNPQIIFDANGKSFSLRECTGNIIIMNKTDAEANNQIHLTGADIEIDISCTNGGFDLSGAGQLVDNSAVGCIIDSTLLTSTNPLTTSQFMALK